MKADDLHDVLVWLGVLAVVAVLGYFGIGRKRAARRDKAGRSSSARKRSE
jgi:hypothetical protein